METFIAALMTPIVLALSYSGGYLAMETDASSVRVGCILLQEQLDNAKKPNRHWSRSFTDSEQRYDTTQHECLETVWSVLLLR